MVKINPNISIFVQLANYIRMDIFSFKRIPGSKLESIREMASLLEVNPNTMKRVYQELENEGLIYTNGNLGTFVTNDKEFILVQRQLFIKDKLQELTEIMSLCGMKEDEVENLIKANINNRREINHG
jgi:DNA-binding transcriptional regulator YhcF (GntR family)